MIKVQKLLEADLTGLGKPICIRDDYPPDAIDDIQTYYGKLAIRPGESSTQVGICVAKNRPLIVDEVECHLETAEILVALTGSFVVPVLPSRETDGTLVPDKDKAIAVRVDQGEAIMFNPGIWHWTPYAVDQPTANVLVIFKEDTPDKDFHGCKFESPLEMA